MANEDLTQDPNYTTPGGAPLAALARNPHQNVDLVHGVMGGSEVASLSTSTGSSVLSLSTSTSTGISATDSAVASLSTLNSTGLSNVVSSLTSLSTSLSGTKESVVSLSTSTSTGLSTASSSILSLSTCLSSVVNYQSGQSTFSVYGSDYSLNSLTGTGATGTVSTASDGGLVLTAAGSAAVNLRARIVNTLNVGNQPFSISKADSFELDIEVPAKDKFSINNIAIYLSSTSGYTTNTFGYFKITGGQLQDGRNKRHRVTWKDFVPSGTWTIDQARVATNVSWQFVLNLVDASVSVPSPSATVTIRNFNSIARSRGSVLFISDDGWATQHQEMYRILHAAGLKGNIAVITSTVGTANYVTLAQLKEMHKNGWGLCNHTSITVRLSGQSIAAQRTAITDGAAYLTSNGLSGAEDILILPNGAYDANTTQVANEQCSLVRTVREGIFSLGQDKQQIKVINLLPANNAAYANAYIDEVEKNGGIVVFLTHKFVNTYTLPTDNLEFSISEYQSIVNYVKTKNVDVLTFNELRDRMFSSEYYISNTLSSIASLSTGLSTLSARAVSDYVVKPLFNQLASNNTVYNIDGRFLLKFDSAKSMSWATVSGTRNIQYQHVLSYDGGEYGGNGTSTEGSLTLTTTYSGIRASTDNYTSWNRLKLRDDTDGAEYIIEWFYSKENTYSFFARKIGAEFETIVPVLSVKGAVGVATYSGAPMVPNTTATMTTFNPSAGTQTRIAADSDDAITGSILSSIENTGVTYGTGIVFRENPQSVKQGNLREVLLTITHGLTGSATGVLEYEVRSVASGAKINQGSIILTAQDTSVSYTANFNTISDAASIAAGYLLRFTTTTNVTIVLDRTRLIAVGK